MNCERYNTTRKREYEQIYVLESQMWPLGRILLAHAIEDSNIMDRKMIALKFLGVRLRVQLIQGSPSRLYFSSFRARLKSRARG